jgi:UBX domain-containing protein 1
VCADTQNHDDDDDDEDEDARRGAELFAGGHRSGLAVQNPDERGGNPGLVNDILDQARR